MGTQVSTIGWNVAANVSYAILELRDISYLALDVVMMQRGDRRPDRNIYGTPYLLRIDGLCMQPSEPLRCLCVRLFCEC